MNVGGRESSNLDALGEKLTNLGLMSQTAQRDLCITCLFMNRLFHDRIPTGAATCMEWYYVLLSENGINNMEM